MNDLLNRLTGLLEAVEGVSAATAACVSHHDRDIVVGIVQGEPELDEMELRDHVLTELDGVDTPLGIWSVPDLRQLGEPVDAGQLLTAIDQEWCVPFEKPDGPVEQSLAALWCRVLGLRRVGARDDFLDLGGDSISATRILVSLEEDFHVALDVRQFMEASSIRDLARTVVEEGGQEPTVRPEPAGG
ncbi:acyl carrier protein [Streptomyces ossamyceticus]|uniref:acyl carrier protein n=1 Tax=Streptomyces ossamyceticus TaxID=249581 RepID=UPI0006E2EA79|nr:acyl carrier protein [Streptomyces ossamyceticus]